MTRPQWLKEIAERCEIALRHEPIYGSDIDRDLRLMAKEHVPKLIRALEEAYRALALVKDDVDGTLAEVGSDAQEAIEQALRIIEQGPEATA